MDVWAGDIELPGGGSIKDVELVTTRAVGPSFDAISLRFLAVVDVARVPLHLAIGSPLEVYSQSDATQDWFSTLLLSGHAIAKNAEPWWQAATAQSPVGILTEVTRGNGDGPSPNLTELLFYAAGPAPGATDSLSPEQLALSISALPLSSELLHKLPTPPLSPVFASDPDDPPAAFLPPPFDPPEVQVANSRKRQSVSSLFDAATARRKRARRHGGENIAAAASGLPLPHNRSTSAASRPPSSDSLHKPLSRSPSLSTDAPPPRRPSTALDTTHAGGGKRSSLSHATAADPAEDQTTASRNKDTISRLVMAGMRMHGLQQQRRTRKASTTTTTSFSQTPAAAAADDDEYKLIYHQTYRGTVFALRNHIASVSLNPHHLDQLREIVDRLLAVFCSDPLEGVGGVVGGLGASEASWLGTGAAGAGGSGTGEGATGEGGEQMTLTPRPKKRTLFGTEGGSAAKGVFGENPFERRREGEGLVHTPETRRVR